jgi:hypothetical protein
MELTLEAQTFRLPLPRVQGNEPPKSTILIRLALVFLTLFACIFPQTQGRLSHPDGTSTTLPGELPFSITDIGLLQEINDRTWEDLRIVSVRNELEILRSRENLRMAVGLANNEAQIRALADNPHTPEDIRAAAREIVDEMNRPDTRAGLAGALARHTEKINDLIEGLANLPGEILAGLFNIAFAIDVTTGAELVYNGLDNGFSINEIPTTQRIISGALILIPAIVGRAPGAVDDVIGLGVRSGRSTPGLRLIGGHVDDIGERIAAREGVWGKNPLQRGIEIEDSLAATEYKDWFRAGQLHNGFFPLVDFQNGRNLVSLKTVDTNGTSWLGRMEDHIRDLAGGHTVDGKAANMILDIRVQPGGSSAATPLIEFGRKNNVTVRITEYP